MDVKIFNSLGTYGETYSYLSSGPKSKDDLLKHLKEKGKKGTTAKEHVKKAVDGLVPYISYSDEILVLDINGITELINEVAGIFQFEAVLEPKRKKKRKPEDNVTVVTYPHSPGYLKQKQAANSANSRSNNLQSELDKKDEEILRLQTLLEENLNTAMLNFMGEKILFLKDVQVKPQKHFQRDFFLNNPLTLLDTEYLSEKYADVLMNPYEAVFSKDKELTTPKYVKRIWSQLPFSKLFRARLDEQDRLSKVKQQEDEQGWVKRESIDRVELEKNRLESVNAILSMGNSVTNQMKLSLYAAWFDGIDPEMVELLNYAGEQDINAEYVILLLEKPREYRNYRTIRGMMQQAKKASEAHIKREAAVELISGDWYVEATYRGKACQFRMMPVTELEEFQELLRKQKSGEALSLIEQMLSEERKASFANGNPDGEILINGTKENHEKKSHDKQIKPPDFLHEKENASGVNCHEKVDEDQALEGFAEAEEKKEGEDHGEE